MVHVENGKNKYACRLGRCHRRTGKQIGNDNGKKWRIERKENDKLLYVPDAALLLSARRGWGWERSGDDGGGGGGIAAGLVLVVVVAVVVNHTAATGQICEGCATTTRWNSASFGSLAWYPSSGYCA